MARTIIQQRAVAFMTPVSTPSQVLLVDQIGLACVANEGAIYDIIMPQGYASGGLTLDVKYWMDTATSGTLITQIRAQKLANATDMSAAASWGTANTTTVNPVPNAAKKLDTTTITLTHANLGSPAAGDAIRLELTRSGGTATGDAVYWELNGTETGS